MNPGPQDEQRPTATSQLLRNLTDMLCTDRISVGEIVDALGDRGLGVLIAVFAIPNIAPSTIPFGNVATGVPVIFLAVHLMAGWPRLALPRFLSRRTVDAKSLKIFMPKLAKALSYVERLFKPRLIGATGPVAERCIGAICLLLSVVSSLPIPFGHNLPALGLMIIGLGLVEHDGYAIIFGSVLGLLGALLLAIVLFGLATRLHPFGLWLAHG